MKRLLSLVAAGLLVSGCQTVSRIDLGPKGLMVREDPCKDLSEHELTAAQEYYLGRAATATLLGKYGAEKVVSPEAPLVRYVARVGQTVAALGAEKSGDPGLRRLRSATWVEDRPWPVGGYHFIVVDWDSPNAHGLPGGFVVLTTGLLRQTQSEEELAGVLAHEVVHVQRGHGVEIVKKSLCTQAHQNDGLVGLAKKGVVEEVSARVPVNVEAFTSEAFDKAVGAWYGVLEKGYGKDDEYEADALGASLAAWSGFGGQGLRSVLGRLPAGRSKGLLSGLTSNHPPMTERLTRLDAIVGELPAPTTAEPKRSQRFLEMMGRVDAPAEPGKG